MRNLDQQLRARLSRLEAADRELAAEMQNVRAREAEARAEEPIPLESAGGVEDELPAPLALETIVLRKGRPVLAIVDSGPRLEFPDVESEVWRARLLAAALPLRRAVRAVGRIELRGHPLFEWVGTGWLVGPDIIVTNRHVAREFALRAGEGFVFRAGAIGRMSASIDFLEEIGRKASLEFAVREILDIADDDEADVAFFRVERTSGGRELASHIELFDRPVDVDRHVAVVGYPARDSRVPDQALMRRIFGDVYDKKRLAPGQVTRTGETLHHDCSTLGGNSGSVVLDLETGRAVALHFAGRFLEANFAVPAPVIANRLDALQRGERPGASRRPDAPKTARAQAPPPAPVAAPGAAAVLHAGVPVPVGPGGATWRFPLDVTISIGAPHVLAAPRPSGRMTADAGEDDAAFEAPLRPEDYVDREGYRADFVGPPVPLPQPAGSRADDVLAFEVDGHREQELRYEHFSVVMSRSRRLCLFSAVNLDGKRSRRQRRTGWRFDPRIPQEAQIRRECYGEAPRFSRGHMTRREDPVWGEPAIASRANTDSMHVTNAVPQMQPFNAGIWLGLEDYALDHAREDDMRISVFTGPFLLEDDPVRFGVQIPRSFWKVIAFIHDGTGELCATGYTLSQEDFLRDEEFVFGQHRTSQRSIAGIEARAGLSLGRLAEIDPFDEPEGIEPPALQDFSQIRFVR